ncbi:sirohydrochlorin chelatase [Micropruina sp.]|uniref:sirohydrochlorin chelatase n=1 Tax=Micropruina sp. TaxID=2737536 RepID=UPI0039E5E9A9
MTAPALVMVGMGSTDAQVAQVAHSLRKGLQSMRAGLSVHCAFLEHSSPTPAQVVGQLIKQGTNEIVLVPLQLTHAIDPDERVLGQATKLRTIHPDLRVQVSRPIGPEVNLLSVLDQRLRASLSNSRVLELDGLVLSSARSGDVRGNALLARRARQWSTHHRLPCLTAVADGSGPSVAQAVQGLRAQGRRHIAVGSFFLTATELFHAQAELAERCGAVSVSEPLGSANEVMELILARYAFAAMDLLDIGFEELDDDLPARHLSIVSA